MLCSYGLVWRGGGEGRIHEDLFCRYVFAPLQCHEELELGLLWYNRDERYSPTDLNCLKAKGRIYYVGPCSGSMVFVTVAPWSSGSGISPVQSIDEDMSCHFAVVLHYVCELKNRIRSADPCFCATAKPQDKGSKNVMLQFTYRCEKSFAMRFE